MATPAQKKLVQQRLADIREANNTRFKWPKWTGFSGKKGWDWIQLLIQLIGAFAIPISIIGLWVNVSQFNAQQKESAQMQATQVAVSAAQTLDQQRQTTLDTYFDRVSELLLTYPDHFKAYKEGDQFQAIVVARTFTALRNLDGTRKAYLIRFLWDAKLIKAPNPIIRVPGADLNDAVFVLANQHPNLSGVSLISDLLYRADLSGVNLVGADLSNAYLNGAHLNGANLNDADLTNTDLNGAYLNGAYLLGADLSNAYLSGANLQGAKYNAETMQVVNAQGTSFTIEPTQWPQGFDPKAAGAICIYC